MSHLLSGIRAEGSIVTRAVLDGPWAIHLADDALLTMVTVVSGRAVVVLADGSETALQAPSTAVVRSPEPFVLMDGPDVLGQQRVEYELSCFNGSCPESLAADLGVWGSACDRSTGLIIGAYRAAGRRHERLIGSLPPVVVVDEEGEVCAWLEATAAETVTRRAGSQALMDRLLDWGLVCTLRNWFELEGVDAPAWYRGYADPLIGPALEAIHDRPDHRWTVASLAAEAGVSRALFAKRFTETIGVPPLTYLTDWRMAEAKDLLAQSDQTVASIARAVGYADAFGFSAAFKRHTGHSPKAYRDTLADAASAVP
jgi:AraC-like DNA-binding protein